MKFSLSFAILAAICCSSCSRKGSASVSRVPPEVVPKEVTFNAHIRPIFSDTCFACHGFDSKKREADLRLDTPEGAYAKLKDSDEKAIVPGKPDESAIMKRLVSTDPEEVMPPPEFHKEITPQQRSLIREWIQQGAKYEEHWAFTPIVRPAVPVPAQYANEVTNPVDAFILATLASEKIEPAPLADKATLLRRLSLDLTGLPPSVAELDSFLADKDPSAYSKQVERLLDSPHYGERMAVPWLDIVRFADTVGYHGDQNARIFPYRDYVIKAFNENMPFDQFTKEQLAGDLLPNATDEQRIATGFLRLNLITREGGAQEKEYLAKSMGDRVRAVGAAWLGLTTGCAECHDHKFDPITAKDFYSLGAFFADIRQWGVYADYGNTPNKDLAGANNDWPFPPEIYIKNPAIERRLTTLQDSAVAMLAASKPDEAALQKWIPQASAFLAANPTGWTPLVPASVTVDKGTHYEISPDQTVVFSGPPQVDEKLTLSFSLPNSAVRAIRLEVLPDSKNNHQVGRQKNGKFAVTPTFAVGAVPLTIAWSQADRRSPHKYNNGEDSPLLEPQWRSAPAVWEEPQNAVTLPHHAIYHLSETLPAADGRVLEITLASADIGKVRFSITPFGDAVVGQENAIRGELAAALKSATPSEAALRELTASWVQSTTPDPALPEAYRSLRASIIACRGGYTHSLVAQAVPSDRIPSTHILPRGAWMNPAEEVKPAIPEFLTHPSLPNDRARLSRMDLAKWITSKENPLTARQFTNRLWKQFFGKGISGTLDDLGNQGEWPSHPQLLDWLAAEFRDSDWNVKDMVRLIVHSRTYRQQSAMRSDLGERDPANRLLSEQSARRLDAEFVRDNALSISGLLIDDTIGGPSVKPYQPENYWANLNFPERDYFASTGDQQYRRGLYMHWQRTFMHPMLAGFDAPSREECTADRFQSNSPQQALTLLNDPSFVEAARAFALRLKGGSDEQRIREAIKLALSRDPKPGETESLTKFLTSQRVSYQAKPDDARAFLKVGSLSPSTDQDPVELAAWSQLCRVILNLHETITRY